MLTKQTLMSFVKAVKPFTWIEYDLTVVGDGYLDDGTRVQLVEEKLSNEPIMINNAWVISASNLLNNGKLNMQYSEMVTKLAKNGGDIIENLTPQKAHCWHMVTGLTGECYELNQAFDNNDHNNIIEECGDLEFYLEGLKQGLNFADLNADVITPVEHSLDDLNEVILNNVKKWVIYNKPLTDGMKFLIYRAIVNYHEKLNYIYDMSKVTRLYVLTHNQNKLMHNDNARYKSGEYSDEQAQQRADKQGEE